MDVQHICPTQNLLKYSLVSLKNHLRDPTLAISYRVFYLRDDWHFLPEFAQIQSDGISHPFLKKLIIKSRHRIPQMTSKSAITSLSSCWTWPGHSSMVSGKIPWYQGYEEGLNTRQNVNETIPCALSLKQAFLCQESTGQDDLGLRWAGINLYE